MRFRTSDGYTLNWNGTVWTDGDLEFAADATGFPIDDTGERLEGEFLS